MRSWSVALGHVPGPEEAWPLVAHAGGELDRTFGWRAGQPISVAAFLHDVATAAGELPSTAHVLNACSDRYLFAVSLAACAQRGIVTLLPPARTPGVIAYLRTDAPDLVLLLGCDDGPSPVAGCRCTVSSPLAAASRRRRRPSRCWPVHS